MSRNLAQLLVFIVVLGTCGWSIFAYYCSGLGRSFTTSVVLREFLETKPVGITFAFGGFIVFVLWEAVRIREGSSSGLTGIQFWVLITSAYLLGHSLWSY